MNIRYILSCFFGQNRTDNQMEIRKKRAKILPLYNRYYKWV